MNIQILDSWLREYLKTEATPQLLAEKMSLTSASIEKLHPFGENDTIYDIEVTQNRPDLMSVIGIAREAAAILPHFDIAADFIEPKLATPASDLPMMDIDIVNNPSLVSRICAVVLEVNISKSPQFVQDRLEASGIRSLNNIIDITNYVMREIGHPTHAFDYDRITTKRMIIRESIAGERMITLDNKDHSLHGGDIVADNGQGGIIDLLGVMGTKNSVVTDSTKRILFFIDNNDRHKIRKTSMSLGIRSEAAVLNEKGVDPELAMKALLRGMELYTHYAGAEQLSSILDIYPNHPQQTSITITQEKINSVIGIEISKESTIKALQDLGFEVQEENSTYSIAVPSWRIDDVKISEDIIEEVARIYGYFNIPNILPPVFSSSSYNIEKDPFYWERRTKQALKLWGFTEVYSYSMVSENLYEGDPLEAVTIANPLTQDRVYMRRTLIPSLLEVIQENPRHDEIKLFELSNVYQKREDDLPEEKIHLAGIYKKEAISFLDIKGIIEQLFEELGIHGYVFKQKSNGGIGADVYINGKYGGEIEILDAQLGDFELNFEVLLESVSNKKVYQPLPKFPPIIEDVRLEIPQPVLFETLKSEIQNYHPLISRVELLDLFGNKKTFRIYYLDKNKNLSNEEVTDIREGLYKTLENKFQAKIG